MELIDFSPFAERRTARRQSEQNSLAMAQASVGDRWAQLHTERPECEIDAGMSPDIEEADFWGDLQFRLAYPTHRLRTY